MYNNKELVKFNQEEIYNNDEEFNFEELPKIKINSFQYKKLEYYVNIENIEDNFSPVKPNCIELESNVKIVVIADIDCLNDLEIGSSFLGIDFEWKSESSSASLMQIADGETIYIFDLLYLNKIPNFEDNFIKIFEPKNFVAFYFSNDLKQVSQKFYNFFSQKDKVIDIKNLYEEKFNYRFCPNLSDLCYKLFRKSICKYFQCSNWEKRPLSKRQIHYAALDSHILLKIYDKLKSIKAFYKEIYIKNITEISSPELWKNIPEYCFKQLEMLDSKIKDRISIKNINSASIQQLKDQNIIIFHLKLVDYGLNQKIQKYFITFETFKVPDGIAKGDDIEIYRCDFVSENLKGNPIYKAGVFSIKDNLITLISDCEMVELPEYPFYCFVKVTNDESFQIIKSSLNQMSNREIPQYSENLVNVLFKYNSVSILENYEEHLTKELFNSSINSCQMKAIDKTIKIKELGLIHGPPGTGKTSTLVELILQAVERGERILVCSHSNTAVDNIAEKLIKYKNKCNLDFKMCRLGRPSKIQEEVFDICIDALINESTLSENNSLLKKLNSDLKFRDKTSQKLIGNKILSLKNNVNKLTELIIDDSQVVLCTNVGAGDIDKTQNYFDLVIIDEAGQSPEYSCWLPILLGTKLIMAGDHKQLPPTILSEEGKSELYYTLFEKMNDHYQEEVSSLLTIQYRMNEKIMK